MSEVRKVADDWQTIYTKSKLLAVPTNDCCLIWKRARWDYIPGKTQIKDGCYCIIPNESDGELLCPCVREKHEGLQDPNFDRPCSPKTVVS